ncbi:MAG: XRE family transcriptional regulator [Hymenobacter sp.]|nr:MAG: XRE family transcriptional regulator [Hymenobacter sp.]
MTRDELLNSREYWIAKIQLDLFGQLDKYMLENNISRTQLAEKLGVTKGYVSQILNGDFDHKVSKLVDLALVMGKVPEITYISLDKYEDEKPTQNIFKRVVPGGQLHTIKNLAQAS